MDDKVCYWIMADELLLSPSIIYAWDEPFLALRCSESSYIHFFVGHKETKEQAMARHGIIVIGDL